jgi:hypothetical protein
MQQSVAITLVCRRSWRLVRLVYSEQ